MMHMPTWLIKYLIGLAFFPGILACLCLLFLGITYHQVKDREEAEHAEG